MTATPQSTGVVTVLYHSRAVLPEFLDSLAAQTHRAFHLYAVDNASGDGSAGFITQRAAELNIPLTLILNDDNRGVAAGNNQGIRAALDAGCEYILLLNNDVRLDPALLHELLAGAVRTRAPITAPLIYLYDSPDRFWSAGGRFQPLLGYRPVHAAEKHRDRGQFSADSRIDYASSCCLLLHRSVFDRIGLMDERYFVYWDDPDLLLRARRASLPLYLIPAARLWHRVGTSTGTVPGFTLHYATRNHAYYLRKHLPAPIAMFWIFLYTAVFAAGSPFSARRRTQLRAWLEGCRIPLA